MADRNLFQKSQAEPPHQKLSRHLTKCLVNSDMDGSYHHTFAPLHQGSHKIPMASFQSYRFAQTQYFYQNRPLQIDQRTFCTTSR